MLHRSNKKAVSEVVAYVLLIVIALSISAMVFVWLKYFVPKAAEECPDSIAIAIKSYSCDTAGNTITLAIKNNGLFNISGFYVYISNETGTLPILEPAFVSSERCSGNEICQRGYLSLSSPLAPNEEFSAVFLYWEHNRINEVEIEPFAWQDKKVVLCKDAIIKQRINGCE